VGDATVWKVGVTHVKSTLRLLAAAVLAAFMTVPFSAPAQAYPDPTITIDLSIPGDELIGGLDFDFTVSSGDVECSAWTVSYRGEDKTGSGTSFSGTFSTPPVDTRTPTTITAVCEYDGSGAFGGTGAEVQAADIASASATVYLLPQSDGGSDNGSLPGTGGSSQWILWAGLGLVVVGGGALVLVRRRTH